MQFPSRLEIRHSWARCATRPKYAPAEDGNAAKTYTVTVTRAAPPAPSPAVAVELSPSGSVDEGTEIALTMSFANLESDSDTSDTDYIFRADVVNADACEGGGMGRDRYMYKVDEDPEVRAGTISASCAPGDYTVEVSISSPGNVELASATVDFTVAAPAQQQQDQEPPPSTDATLSNLALSNVDFGVFTSSATRYTASVANDVTQTTVTPTTTDDGASYEIRLSGVADADGTVLLAVGSNVITVEVTAEDGNTIKTYTVTVTRTAPPLSADATLSGLILSGVNFGNFDSATTGYIASVANDVTQTTVTPTTNGDGATYEIKLGGVTDDDSIISLSVGSNTITVEVTAEDGNTARTYTVTVTRAAPVTAPPGTPARPSGEITSPGTVALDWNDVPTATSYDVRFWLVSVNGFVELSPDASVHGISITFDGSSATVSGLATSKPGHDGWYAFAIRAVNDAGSSGWSRNNRIAVPEQGAPETPERPSGEITSPGTVALDWNDVPTATSYDVSFWLVSVNGFVELSPDGPVHGISITFDGSSATVSGLATSKPGHDGWYAFSIRAVNDAGSSGWSGNNRIAVP